LIKHHLDGSAIVPKVSKVSEIATTLAFTLQQFGQQTCPAELIEETIQTLLDIRPAKY
jgi:hypothetical protein